MRDVVILMHRAITPADLKIWAVHDLMRFWDEDGIDYEVLYGMERFVPARVVLTHIDLSVVPEAYLEFARRWERTINASVRDIRKSTYSELVLSADQPFHGPAIVKSNHNCAGHSERVLHHRDSEVEVPPPLPVRMRGQLDYVVYGDASTIPRAYFEHPGLIVERLCPELEGTTYYTRSYHFLGDRWTCVRLGASQPIVIGRVAHTIDAIEPHPRVLEVRREFGLDYGKIDYVVVDGEAIILDVNKTTGSGGQSENPAVLAQRRHRAEGIRAFLS